MDMNNTQYIDYEVGVWTYESSVQQHQLIENITTHRCNETDR